MKLTKQALKEIIKEVIAEADGHPNMLKQNKEIPHNWATHVAWKSSVYENKYGKLGEVVHHTLFEDGTITQYDVKFGNKLVKSIPANMLEVKKQQEHSHEADEGDNNDDDKAESNCS